MLSQVRFFVPTVEMHASPAAVAFWQGQVASAMRMPADGDAFRAAAQAVAAASAGTHYSYARDGAQRSTTILGGLDGVSEQRCSGNLVVAFAVEESMLQAARRHITRVEHGVAAAGAESASSCATAVVGSSPVPSSLASPDGGTARGWNRVEHATPAALPGYGHVVSGGEAVMSEDEQLAMALSLSMAEESRHAAAVTVHASVVDPTAGSSHNPFMPASMADSNSNGDGNSNSHNHHSMAEDEIASALWRASSLPPAVEVTSASVEGTSAAVVMEEEAHI